MKNKIKITALLAATLFLSSFSKASDIGTETSKQIQEHLFFPNIIIQANQTNKVEVLFTTDNDGKVNFVLAKTENKDLKKEIEKHFSNLTLKDIKPNVCHAITLKLKIV
jgi:hypothetical protein